MAIDTNDLSKKTYNAILTESGKFNENLTLQFGLLSYECENEKEYIEKAENLIYNMLNHDENDVDDIFFGEPPTMKSFHKALQKILTNIATLKK